jgi:hypothetical protein
MGWSYRADRTDELYGNVPGPALVSGETQTGPPATPLGRTKTYVASGAIDVRSHIAYINKPVSLAAMTLAAPTADGIAIEIVVGSAFVHTVTATGLIDDGVTGGAKTTITFTGGFVGSSISLVSFNGHWCVRSKNVAAIT